MNKFYQNVANKLTAYFPVVPCICNGVTYTQTGTSNIFRFAKGMIRFKDQSNPLSAAQSQVQATFANIDVADVTVSCPDASGNYYVVALLTMTQVSPSQVTFSAAILPTSMTLAQIAATGKPDFYLPLYRITNTNGVYALSVNSNCAVNPYYSLKLEGTPTAPTATAGTNTTQLATTAFVQSHITPGNYAQLAANQTFTGTNTFSGSSNFGGVAMGSAYVTGVTTTNGQCYLSYGNGAPSGITVFSNPGSQGSTCYIGSNNGGAGGYNGINFGANQSRPWLNNLGTTNNTSSAIATLSDVIGVGQTWQDVTSSRAEGATYTNTTSKPIEVSIILSIPASTVSVYIYLIVDSVNVSCYNDSNGVIVTQQAIVPPKSTYRFSLGAGYITYFRWLELR